MLTPEQETEVKKQLIEQIDSSFPEDKKAETKKQVELMSSEELEQFVKRGQTGEGQECIFCSIVSGKSPSYKIAENESAIAVLEINPISKGHVLIMPKKHASFKEFPELMEFAKQIADLIKERLSPKDVEIASLDFQGHGVINLIPVYSNESIKSERYHADKKELNEALSLLKSSPKEIKNEKPKKKVEKKSRKKRLNSKKLWLPKRIP